KPETVSVGMLAPKESGRADFIIWSTTREDLNVSIPEKAKTNPLFVYELRRVTKEELARQPPQAYVLAGYQLTITVHEQAGGKQLDQGAFYHHVPLLLDGEPLYGVAPIVRGSVQGDIEIGVGQDQGKVNLKSFSAKEGTKLTLPFWTDAKANIS